MHGDADGSGLIGNGAGDGLPDPPRRIGGELEALGVVKLLHSLDEAQVALLNQVKEEHTAPDIALGDGDDQTQVGLGQLLFGRLRLRATLEHLLGDLDFLVGGQQRNLADLLEVHAHRVVDAHALGHGEIKIRLSGLLRDGGGLLRDDVHALGFEHLKHRVNRIRVNIQLAELVHDLLIGQRLLFIFGELEDLLDLLLSLLSGQCHSEIIPFFRPSVLPSSVPVSSKAYCACLRPSSGEAAP